ncbi:efflux RND transporter permease subunit [Phocaeicola faecalis]|jgi:multidrug efflux pump subunit AcrB|uniref:efflux RND transporter permease subunit n=1 Tax=Phocaeicola faecalis TaxID=2786956 RepID=UPI001F2FC729|nr:efflux RND transporter permease subunit [Phocaeicola faecalis]
MVKFLLQRPIAVLMAFTACFIVGLVTYFSLPVSLLPDIAIPQITIQVSGENSSARELENTVVTPVRRQLLQVAGLREIKSETRDGAGIIRMEFEFGVNTDLAFIEVNEKIDAAMNSLPKEVARPKAIKASATDIPVFYLNMTLKNDRPYEGTNEQQFLDMCELAENVVKRRIEQLPEVAMADITGVPGKLLQIVPDKDKLAMTGITVEDIENALASNNVEPGSMLVRDGYYEYNIRIATLLRTPEDVKNIYIRKGDRILQLKELCKVDVVSQKESGLSVAGGKKAVTLAIIKQSDENMDEMKEKLKETTDYFASLYPDIEFSVSRNQTELLDYTISNLQQNLSLGFLFIFIVAILFLGDIRSPLVIGISMVTSIVITFFFFYFCHVSLNVISLSGLILAVGMMIDSSIIVTENISQYRERGYSLKRSCAVGTTEMITPMLSSSLTTIAVFLPLIFMSGIAGAIFMDQAFSITVGLMISYVTGIMLLPVLYLLFYRAGIRSKSFLSKRFDNLLKNEWLEGFYDKGIDWVFSHKKISLLGTLATLPVCVFFFYFMEKERMPEIDQNELIMRIEWNENIHVDENNRRVDELMKLTDGKVTEHTAYVGMQDYILNGGSELSSTEAELYFKTGTPTEILPLQDLLTKEVEEKYPLAVVSFSPPETIFEKLFVTGEADIVAELHVANKSKAPEAEQLQQLEKDVIQATGMTPTGIAFRNQLNLVVNREKLLLYNIAYEELTRVLRTAFKENKVSTLRSYQQYLPIGIAGEEKSVNRILNETLVQTLPDKNRQVNYIPLSELVSIVPAEDLKSITAGKNGEYIPLSFYDVENPTRLMKEVKETVKEKNEWEVDFSGSFFSNEKMMGELTVILFVSLLLMYFILCAQFESFLQPLIVLLEIPIDTAFALITLWALGHTLNLMSAIGIIVTCGIVVNDSILKLDTINELRKAGVPLVEAIHTAGKRRLRAIIMTSLTTIFAMVPLLFTSDMGSELQKPLSIAMIGSMVVGTLVSLFIIPLIYWFIYRKHDKNEVR